MNLFQQLNVAAGSTFSVSVEKRKTRRGGNKPWDQRQGKTEARYRQVLEGKELTTGQIAGALDISHMGALKYLYTLEERKLVRRVGIAPRQQATRFIPGRGQIIWTWNNKEQ